MSQPTVFAAAPHGRFRRVLERPLDYRSPRRVAVALERSFLAIVAVAALTLLADGFCLVAPPRGRDLGWVALIHDALAVLEGSVVIVGFGLSCAWRSRLRANLRSFGLVLDPADESPITLAGLAKAHSLGLPAPVGPSPGPRRCATICRLAAITLVVGACTTITGTVTGDWPRPSVSRLSQARDGLTVSMLGHVLAIVGYSLAIVVVRRVTEQQERRAGAEVIDLSTIPLVPAPPTQPPVTPCDFVSPRRRAGAAKAGLVASVVAPLVAIPLHGDAAARLHVVGDLESRRPRLQAAAIGVLLSVTVAAALASAWSYLLWRNHTRALRKPGYPLLMRFGTNRQPLGRGRAFAWAVGTSLLGAAAAITSVAIWGGVDPYREHVPVTEYPLIRAALVLGIGGYVILAIGCLLWARVISVATAAQERQAAARAS